MWMIDPRYLCRKHLLGCHLEHHMFLGALKKGKRLKGFFLNNCFEPKSLKSSHDELVLEMQHRTYNHQTPISQEEFDDAIKNLTDEEMDWCIDREASLKDLLMRCVECGARFNHYDGLDEAASIAAQHLADYIDNEIIQSIVRNNTIS
jgi:hypothetical protein